MDNADYIYIDIDIKKNGMAKNLMELKKTPLLKPGFFLFIFLCVWSYMVTHIHSVNKNIFNTYKKVFSVANYDGQMFIFYSVSFRNKDYCLFAYQMNKDKYESFKKRFDLMEPYLK